MSFLWHSLMSYVWGVLFVLGVLVGAVLWLGMAAWDSIRRVFGRLSGEVETHQDPKPS